MTCKFSLLIQSDFDSHSVKAQADRSHNCGYMIIDKTLCTRLTALQCDAELTCSFSHSDNQRLNQKLHNTLETKQK